MSYILQEPQTFLNVKLTNLGRRQLALGQLTFSTYAFSDREANYSIDRTGSYDLTLNRILSPVDAQPNLSANFDGTNPQPLLSQYVSTAKQFSTAHTASYGFFSGVTTGYTNYYIDSSKILGSDALFYSANTNGGNIITLAGSGDAPTVGDFVRIGWSNPNFTQNLPYNGNIVEYSATPLNYLFYRIVSGSSSPNTYMLDRDIPNFNNAYNSSSVMSTNAIFYPSQPIESFYGSGSTVDPQLWNMNIVRTVSLPGTINGISGYTSYGSIEYNGTKQYLGFSSDTPAFGVIHYTNNFTGNTYAEQLIEGSVVMEIPYLMWWNTPGNNGQVMTQGLVLYDGGNDATITDTVAGTTYRNLKDSLSSNALVVGRVYHKLKIIIITDQELLAAMSYKANRNWTLPNFNLNLVSSPKYPLAPSQATGLCQSGYTYYVTYMVNSQPYSPGVSYGYGNGLFCGYIQQIDGATDAYGNPQYLSLSFPTNSFPFLRNSAEMTSSSGTGWNANSVQILVNQQLSGYTYQIGDVPSDQWVAVSNVVGNGIYTGDTTDLTIDPLKLAGYNFIMSAQDYASGTSYVLDTIFSGETDFNNLTGLTFGNETFFYGNITADIMATTYKTLITAVAANNDYNDSLNDSYDGLLDTNTYITEVDIFDSNNNLVAVGKPSYPITKNSSRYIVVQLEMDF